MKGVIIQGGSLIFDDNQDVTLNAEYIIVTDGGVIQVGTKENPFVHKATITLYGTIASTQLPIYGAKVLGLRNGVLDMHGTSIGVGWTYLNITAEAKSNQIGLRDYVNWPVGGQVVIASTGDKNSQNQSETNYITAISADGRILTLKNPLKYQHLSVKRLAGGEEVYIRAEVGLLTRNVVFNAIDCDVSTSQNENECNSESNSDDNSGDNSDDNSDDNLDKSSKCSSGSSNYYSSSGANQFGAILMISTEQPNITNNESVKVRISNVESIVYPWWLCN